MEKRIEFEAQLVGVTGMDACYVEFPFSVPELFGTKGQVKVKALIDGVGYRGSLANMGGGCHVLGMTKAIRKQIGKSTGDFVTISIEKDSEERSVSIPEVIAEVLNKNEKARVFFEGLSYTNKKEYVSWILSAKKEETKGKRLSEMIKKLEQGFKSPTLKIK